VYKNLIRPLLFLFRPETVHRLVVSCIKALFLVPGVMPLVRSCYRVRHPSLQRKVFGLNFENPVGLAAGFDKDARYFNQLAAFGFSFIEVGTVTPLSQPGNPKPRSFRLRTDSALINRMGFNNRGSREAAQRLGRRRTGIVIGGNLGKNTATSNENAVEDYAAAFQDLYEVADYFAVNVSCPNISDLSHLQDREQLEGILSRLDSIHEKTGGELPIIGVGGIMSPLDAREKLQAGANLIQLYTGFIYEGPSLVRRINRSLL
jgi:dihydroorotate dehydrogenase